jgi:hypothetical protein
MVIVGLRTDFLCSGGELLDPEMAFDISNDNPKYRINGLMDKISHYNNKFCRIQDFKSNKKVYEGGELTSNVQAMMYSLASRKLWPELVPVVDFIFLQFPENPIQRLKFSDSQLRGFEMFLADIYKQMQEFDEAAARSNFAARQPFPKPDEGFCGPLMCGRAKFDGQLKKDGSVMFRCSQKFPYDYWALCNENGETVKTSKADDLKPNQTKGEFVVKKKYGGCPAHKQY